MTRKELQNEYNKNIDMLVNLKNTNRNSEINYIANCYVNGILKSAKADWGIELEPEMVKAPIVK